MRKLITAAVATALVGLAVVPAAASIASAAAAEPATAYGLCVNKSTGLVRALERNALSKSVHGACRKTETKIKVPSVTGLVPKKIVKRFTDRVETCTPKTATVWDFTCTEVAVPSPTPTPSTTATS